MTAVEWTKKKKRLIDGGWKEETNEINFMRNYKSKPNEYQTTIELDYKNKKHYFWNSNCYQYKCNNYTKNYFISFKHS